MNLLLLSTVLSIVALALVVYALIALVRTEAWFADELERQRTELFKHQLEHSVPPAPVAALETRLTALADECAGDRMSLGKLADRVHRLSGRVSGLQRAPELNADPEPQDREQLRAALLKGHHAVGTNRE